MKGGKICWNSLLHRVESKASWIHCFLPKEGQNFMAIRTCGRGSCPPQASQKVEREKEESRMRHFPKAFPYLLLSPIFYDLLIDYWVVNSAVRYSVYLVQSPVSDWIHQLETKPIIHKCLGGHFTPSDNSLLHHKHLLRTQQQWL